MNRKSSFVLLLILMMILNKSAMAAIITEDNCPSINSESNLCNGGQIFTDGEYFYTTTTPNGYLCRLDNYLEEDGIVMDQLAADGRFVLNNGWVYFVGRKKTGIYRFQLYDGEAQTMPERIISGNILNYAINDKGIYYTVRDRDGIYRAECDGSGQKKITGHSISTKNNVVRMMAFGDKLYYVNSKDKGMYVIDCEGSKDAKRIGKAQVHYFTMAMYNGKPVIIYTKYASTSDELYTKRLAVMDMDGNDVEDLEYLCDIKSRYINYMSGYLYYVDSKDGKKLKRISVSGDNPVPQVLIQEEVGYIHVFDNWVAVLGLDGHMRYFINLETLNTYRVSV